MAVDNKNKKINNNMITRKWLQGGWSADVGIVDYIGEDGNLYSINDLTGGPQIMGGSTSGRDSEGGGGSQECFVAGTKVLMTNNSNKNIEDVKVGDYVTIANPFWSEEKGFIAVDEERCNRVHQWVIDSNNGNDVQSLDIGDALHYYDDSDDTLKQVIVENIEYILEKDIRTYDITVEDNHTFFANGILTHNSGTGGGGWTDENWEWFYCQPGFLGYGVNQNWPQCACWRTDDPNRPVDGYSCDRFNVLIERTVSGEYNGGDYWTPSGNSYGGSYTGNGYSIWFEHSYQIDNFEAGNYNQGQLGKIIWDYEFPNGEGISGQTSINQMNQQGTWASPREGCETCSECEWVVTNVLTNEGFCVDAGTPTDIGCTDSSACNFNPTAAIACNESATGMGDNECCLYFDQCGFCGGNNLAFVPCGSPDDGDYCSGGNPSNYCLVWNPGGYSQLEEENQHPRTDCPSLDCANVCGGTHIITTCSSEIEDNQGRRLFRRPGERDLICGGSAWQEGLGGAYNPGQFFSEVCIDLEQAYDIQEESVQEYVNQFCYNIPYHACSCDGSLPRDDLGNCPSLLSANANQGSTIRHTYDDTGRYVDVIPGSKLDDCDDYGALNMAFYSSPRTSNAYHLNMNQRDSYDNSQSDTNLQNPIFPTYQMFGNELPGFVLGHNNYGGIYGSLCSCGYDSGDDNSNLHEYSLNICGVCGEPDSNGNFGRSWSWEGGLPLQCWDNPAYAANVSVCGDRGIKWKPNGFDPDGDIVDLPVTMYDVNDVYGNGISHKTTFSLPFKHPTFLGFIPYCDVFSCKFTEHFNAPTTMQELSPEGLAGWNVADSTNQWQKSFSVPLLQGAVIQKIRNDASEWCYGNEGSGFEYSTIVEPATGYNYSDWFVNEGECWEHYAYYHTTRGWLRGFETCCGITDVDQCLDCTDCTWNENDGYCYSTGFPVSPDNCQPTSCEYPFSNETFTTDDIFRISLPGYNHNFAKDIVAHGFDVGSDFAQSFTESQLTLYSQTDDMTNGIPAILRGTAADPQSVWGSALTPDGNINETGITNLTTNGYITHRVYDKLLSTPPVNDASAVSRFGVQIFGWGDLKNPLNLIHDSIGWENNFIINKLDGEYDNTLTSILTGYENVNDGQNLMLGLLPSQPHENLWVGCPVMIEGCMDSYACNYNPLANYDDESFCEYETCKSCIDTQGLDNPFATGGACNVNNNCQSVGGETYCISDNSLCEYPFRYGVDIDADGLPDVFLQDQSDYTSAAYVAICNDFVGICDSAIESGVEIPEFIIANNTTFPSGDVIASGTYNCSKITSEGNIVTDYQPIWGNSITEQEFTDIQDSYEYDFWPSNPLMPLISQYEITFEVDEDVKTEIEIYDYSELPNDLINQLTIYITRTPIYGNLEDLNGNLITIPIQEQSVRILKNNCNGSGVSQFSLESKCYEEYGSIIDYDFQTAEQACQSLANATNPDVVFKNIVVKDAPLSRIYSNSSTYLLYHCSPNPYGNNLGTDYFNVDYCGSEQTSDGAFYPNSPFPYLNLHNLSQFYFTETHGVTDVELLDSQEDFSINLSIDNPYNPCCNFHQPGFSLLQDICDSDSMSSQCCGGAQDNILNSAYECFDVTSRQGQGWIASGENITWQAVRSKDFNWETGIENNLGIDWSGNWANQRFYQTYSDVRAICQVQSINTVEGNMINYQSNLDYFTYVNDIETYDSFSYIICNSDYDGSSNQDETCTDEFTHLINVMPVLDKPVIEDKIYETFEQQAITITITYGEPYTQEENFTDVDSPNLDGGTTPFTIQLVGDNGGINPDVGDVVLGPNDMEITFTPAADFYNFETGGECSNDSNNCESIAYRVTDDTGVQSETGYLHVKVYPIIDIISADFETTALEDVEKIIALDCNIAGNIISVPPYEGAPINLWDTYSVTDAVNTFGFEIGVIFPDEEERITDTTSISGPYNQNNGFTALYKSESNLFGTDIISYQCYITRPEDLQSDQFELIGTTTNLSMVRSITIHVAEVGDGPIVLPIQLNKFNNANFSKYINEHQFTSIHNNSINSPYVDPHLGYSSHEALELNDVFLNSNYYSSNPTDSPPNWGSGTDMTGVTVDSNYDWPVYPSNSYIGEIMGNPFGKYTSTLYDLNPDYTYLVIPNNNTITIPNDFINTVDFERVEMAGYSVNLDSNVNGFTWVDIGPFSFSQDSSDLFINTEIDNELNGPFVTSQGLSGKGGLGLLGDTNNDGDGIYSKLALGEYQMMRYANYRLSKYGDSDTGGLHTDGEYGSLSDATQMSWLTKAPFIEPRKTGTNLITSKVTMREDKTSYFVVRAFNPQEYDTTIDNINSIITLSGGLDGNGDTSAITIELVGLNNNSDEVAVENPFIYKLDNLPPNRIDMTTMAVSTNSNFDIIKYYYPSSFDTFGSFMTQYSDYYYMGDPTDYTTYNQGFEPIYNINPSWGINNKVYIGDSAHPVQNFTATDDNGDGVPIKGNLSNFVHKCDPRFIPKKTLPYEDSIPFDSNSISEHKNVYLWPYIAGAASNVDGSIMSPSNKTYSDISYKRADFPDTTTMDELILDTNPGFFNFCYNHNHGFSQQKGPRNQSIAEYVYKITLAPNYYNKSVNYGQDTYEVVDSPVVISINLTNVDCENQEAGLNSICDTDIDFDLSVLSSNDNVNLEIVNTSQENLNEFGNIQHKFYHNTPSVIPPVKKTENVENEKYNIYEALSKNDKQDWINIPILYKDPTDIGYYPINNTTKEEFSLGVNNIVDFDSSLITNDRNASDANMDYSSNYVPIYFKVSDNDMSNELGIDGKYFCSEFGYTLPYQIMPDTFEDWRLNPNLFTTETYQFQKHQEFVNQVKNPCIAINQTNFGEEPYGRIIINPEEASDGYSLNPPLFLYNLELITKLPIGNQFTGHEYLFKLYVFPHKSIGNTVNINFDIIAFEGQDPSLTSESMYFKRTYYWELLLELFNHLGFGASSGQSATVEECFNYFSGKYALANSQVTSLCDDMDRFNSDGPGGGSSNDVIGMGIGSGINSGWEHALDFAGFCDVDLSLPCQSDNGVAYSVANPPQINNASTG